MENKIFVGNLPFKVEDNELKEMFSQFGEIEEAVVIKDKYTRRSKGFGFVTFKDDDSAKKAVEELNEKEIQGRNIKVNIAKPREE